jgi:hypothetical protein
MLRLLPILLIAITVLSAGVALGAPADIDRGFGSEGRVVVDFGGSDDAYGVVVQPDGKLVVVGDTSNSPTPSWPASTPTAPATAASAARASP